MTVRLPAVAGSFYEARTDCLERDVRSLLPSDLPKTRAFGAIVPHAGYIYSGGVAGAVYARLEIPAACVVLCPNHTGRGAPAAVDPSEAWRTPLGDVPVNARLSARLRQLAPFLQMLRPGAELVPVCLGQPSLALCREVGEALARLRTEETEPPLLLASSD